MATQTCPFPSLQELEKLRDSLEATVSSSVAQQEIRTQRENELAALKKTLEDETKNHEAILAAMKQKQVKAAQEINDQMEALKRVWCVYLSFTSSPSPSFWREGEGQLRYVFISPLGVAWGGG